MATQLPGPITKKTFKERISRWLQIIKNGESGCILFTPRMDRHRRIIQLLDNPTFLKRQLGFLKNYKFLFLDFDYFPVEDTEDLGDYITSQLNVSDLQKRFNKFNNWLNYLKKKKIKLVLLVLNAEKLFQEPYKPIFLFLASIVEQNSGVQALLFFEQDLTNPNNMRIISTRTAILQNILYYPLYKKQDIKQFILYLSKKWNFKIPKNLVKIIIKECGGHFLLVKEAVRYYKAKPKASLKDMFNHEEIKLRIEWIYSGFSETEQQVLRKISFNKSSFNAQEKHSLSYLKRIGVLSLRGKLTIPLLLRYLKQKEDQKSKLVLKDQELFLNNIPIKIFFSRQEYRVLKGLMIKQGDLVIRDEIAKLIWPTNTDANYSDWAIDQLIRRLRKKLAKLFISPKALKTVRGQGYLLTLG